MVSKGGILETVGSPLGLPSGATTKIQRWEMKAGLVDGRHYTEYVELVKRLKRQGKLDRAESLLLRLVVAVEEEAKAEKWIVAPWYYEQLAIIYRKQKDETKELDILKRFAGQTHGEPHPLLDRLRKIEAKRRTE